MHEWITFVDDLPSKSKLNSTKKQKMNWNIHSRHDTQSPPIKSRTLAIKSFCFICFTTLKNLCNPRFWSLDQEPLPPFITENLNIFESDFRILKGSWEKALSLQESVLLFCRRNGLRGEISSNAFFTTGKIFPSSFIFSLSSMDFLLVCWYSQQLRVQRFNTSKVMNSTKGQVAITYCKTQLRNYQVLL